MATATPLSSVEEEGRALVERLGGRWTARGGMCRCPAHDDRTPSLSVRAGRSRLLLHCFAGCSPPDILRALAQHKLLGPGPCADPTPPRAPAGDALASSAIRLWGAARDLENSPALAYLAGRGLRTGSTELRYHERTPHGPKPLTRFRPAMLAAVRDEGGVVAVHRTFLDPCRAQLAAIPAAKCGLGPFGSGAVRLAPAGPRLGLAEGIETALSATALFGLPCWATLGTERFARIAIPEQVEQLILFLDHDAGGRRAERLARAAFAHLAVTARYPTTPGADWNDVLREQGERQTG